MSEYLPQIIQQTFNGLSLGAIYALIAIGYTMVYGIIGMINFAHGEIYMIGAYVGLVTLTAVGTQGSVPLPLLIGLMLVAAMAVTALYGYSVERIAYRPVRGGPRLVALISAQYKDIVAFGLLILILLFRPSGLLGKPEVEKV